MIKFNLLIIMISHEKQYAVKINVDFESSSGKKAVVIKNLYANDDKHYQYCTFRNSLECC